MGVSSDSILIARRIKVTTLCSLTWLRRARSQIQKSVLATFTTHKGADAFLRELIGELRGQFGRSRGKLEFRTDAAFFNEKAILKRLERSRSEFAIKAPFWPWLGLKEVVAGRKRWHSVSDEIDVFSIK